MKKYYCCSFAGRVQMVVVALSAFNSQFSTTFAQGSLTPPGPPAATMKTLQQIEPRLPLNILAGDSSDLFIVNQPGSYYLTTNIVVGAATNGMRIVTNDVVIDLNGFTISGTASRAAVRTAGSNLGRVRLRNGQLAGWRSGIDFVSNGVVTNAVFEDLQLTMAGSASFAYGIGCGGDAARVSRCSVTGLTGSDSIAISVGDHSLIVGCEVANCYAGILASSDCSVKDCRIRGCPGGDGLSVASSCIVQRNQIYGCKSGISLEGSSCVVTENSCQNSSPANGFNVSGNFNRIENNVAIGNGSFGFISQGNTTNNVVVRNIARGNPSGNYVLNNTDVAGPIISDSGTITNTNPWANFSY
jgi:parallel beta-helix repeat protein